MEFVSVRDFRLRPAEIWEKLKRQDIVITSNGRPIALLTPLEGRDLEEVQMLLRRMRAQIAVTNMRSKAAELGLNRLTSKEIDDEIRLARSEWQP